MTGDLTSDLRFDLSAFDGIRSRSPRGHSMSWEGMKVRFGTVSEAAPGTNKTDQKVWSPARYRPGTTRGAANVESVSCLVMDYDDGTTIEAASETWSDVAHIIHTSWSHTQGHHKFRVIVPLAKPCPADLWPRMWGWAHRRAPQIDPACKDSSRVYFVPVCPEGAPRYGMAHDAPFLDIDPRRLSDPSARKAPKPEGLPAPDRAARRALIEDESARRWAAGRLGADVTGEPPRAEGISCPSCGRASVWFWIRPGPQARAECDHEGSCGWRGHLDELTGPAGVPVAAEIPRERVRDPLSDVVELARKIRQNTIDDKAFGSAVNAIARKITPGVATDLDGNTEWKLAVADLREAAAEVDGMRWITDRIKRLTDAVRDNVPGREPAPVIAVSRRSEADPGVLEHLDIREKDGAVLPTLLNITRILRHDTRWRGRIAYNEFSMRVEVDKDPASDHVETSCALWIAENYGVHVPTPKVAEAMGAIARESTYHEVRDWLGSLRWDGVERIDRLVSRYFDAEHTDINRAISRRWMVSAVARVMPAGTGFGNSGGPGCKVDTMMVLAGKQGAFKSTGLKVLCGEKWFQDSALNINHSADPYMKMRGVWIYEVAEVDGWNKREQADIKAFLSVAVDHYRPSYGRNVVAQPRQCVFAGTTNHDDFLSDPTGSRRYWPVTAGTVRLDDLRRDRDQLWAEAVQVYNDGEPWFMTESERIALQAESSNYYQSDSWEAAIMAFASQHWEYGLTVGDMLRGAVRMEQSKITKRDEMRVTKILAANGWGKQRLRALGDARPTVWYPDGETPPKSYRGWDAGP